MWNKYLVDFMEQFEYPMDARKELQSALREILDNKDAYTAFNELIQRYDENMKCDFNAMRIQMQKISSKTGIHEYAGFLLLFISLSPKLKQYYLEAGLDEALWFDSMCDLKWKLMECKDVHNIWGTFAANWYRGIFHMECFRLGRLHFEVKTFGREYQKNGLCLKPDSPVINVHIPRTGEKLDRESVLEAYKLASEFFKDVFKEEPAIFVCKSWLLYPRNKEVLSEKSNLYSFISDFDVFEWGEYEDYSDAWRLFDTQYDGNVDHLPQNTSLRRAYADWIRRGEKMGWGYGVFSYEKNLGREDNMQTNYFHYQEEKAQNPYIGFTSFQHFRGEELYSDIVVKPENNMRETENIEPYPVPDYVPQNGRSEGYYPDTTVAYIRILWKEFEPVQGEYHYEVIEDVLKKADECGQTVMFRLMPHSTRAEDDVPEWLKEIVDCPERPEGARMKDSPTDPKYLELFGKAMEKIAERFDDDPRLDIVDICLPGAWGEGHKIDQYPEEVLKAHMDVYTRAFKKTHLLGQVLEPHLAKYANEARPVGWRGDGIGQENLMTVKFPYAVSVLPDLWEKSPVSFEAYWWMGEWYRQGWDLDQIIESCLEWHVSTFNAKSLPIPYEWADKVKYWNSKMGYHYVIDYFKCPQSAKVSEEVELEWCIDNVGVAPIYRPIPCKIRLTDGEHAYIFETDIDIRNWMPGKHANHVTIKLPEGIKAGTYKVEIGIMNKAVGQIYFATDAESDEAYYVVGKIDILY